MPLSSDLPNRWDLETDVVVVGSGFAGAVSAIEAHDAGCRTIILELRIPFTPVNTTGSVRGWLE